MGKILKRLGLFCAVATILMMLLISRYFWSNAGRFEHLGIGRYSILKSMLELRLTSARYSIVNGEPRAVLTWAKVEPSPHRAIDEYMNSHRWEFQDQLGVANFYDKHAKQMQVDEFSFAHFFILNYLHDEP